MQCYIRFEVVKLTLKYAIIPERKFIITEYEGDVFASGLLDITQQLWNDPAYNIGYNFVSDVSKCHVNLSGAKIFQILKMISSSMPPMEGKGSIVMTKNIFTSVVSMMFNNSPIARMNKVYTELEPAYKEHGFTSTEILQYLDDERYGKYLETES